MPARKPGPDQGVTDTGRREACGDGFKGLGQGVEVDERLRAVPVELGIGVDDGEGADVGGGDGAELGAVAKGCRTVCGKGGGIAGGDAAGDPRAHGMKAVAAMHDDVELTGLGQGKEIAFDDAHGLRRTARAPV
jgi:hypothetical protein